MGKDLEKKLTVTIPSYRQPEMLSRALLALSKQTYTDFEVVIIDDNSGIDLYKIKDQYKMLCITIIKNENNLGAMKNMLASILYETESDYIFSHHEDDFINTNYLENTTKILESNKNVSFVVTSPKWVNKTEDYIERRTSNEKCLLYTAPEFVYAILENKPFIFGSVVYRKKDLIKDWEYEKYNTFCDRYLLTHILEENNSLAAFLPEPGIFVRNHSLDKEDSRSQYATEENLVNLFKFYKPVMGKKYKKNIVNKKITNNLLFGYSNFKKKTPLLKFIQKNNCLIQFKHLSLLGIYSLAKVIFKLPK